MPRKILFVLLWMVLAGAARSESTWLTVAGDPDDLATNVIQVDPVDRDGDTRTMRVRVSRATPRVSWDGVPYRSYESNVLFDCSRQTARYLSITFFARPGWQGEPLRTVDYATGTPRWMEFRDVEPNPNRRIVNAACPATPGPR